MKRILFFVFLLICCIYAQAQSSKNYTYLIVRFEGHKAKGDSYYTIVAETGNKHASEVYGLVPFKAGNYSIDQPAFYQVRTDTTTVFYNCFQNTTEALNFLGERRWELVSVNNEISSGWYNSSGGAVTTISSSPVYYFRKELN